MAFTQTDLDTLDRAIASGELTVRVGDRLVTYQSFDDMSKRRALIASSIASAAGTPAAYPRHQLADFSDD